MPWSPGECGNPNGRPRSISRELDRIERAAAHIDRLAEQACMAALRRGEKPDFDQINADLAAKRETLARDVRHLRRVIDALRDYDALIELALKAPHRGRRRSRRRASQEERRFVEDVQRAAVALDRLIGEEHPQ